MLRVASEQRGGKTLLDRVVDLDGVFKVLDLHGVQDGDKDLVLNNVGVGGNGGDGGDDKVSGTVEDLSSGEDLAALGLDGLDSLAVVLNGGLGVEGSAEGTGLEGVADADGLVGLDELLNKLIMDLLMEQQASGSRASLAGSTDSSKQDGSQCQIQIGIIHHNNCVVSSQLEQRLSKPLGNSLTDLTSNSSGAGEGEELDTLVIDHGLTDIGTTGDEGAELTGETVLDEDLFEDLCDGDGGEVGGWCALPDDGVSADEGDSRVPA